MIKLSNELKFDETKLDDSFDEAATNELFINFVARLKVDKSILKKYTTSLEDSFKEYEHCLNCTSLGECQNRLTGYAYLPKINKGIKFEYKPCRFKQKQDKKYTYLKNMKFYNMAENLKEASFDNIDKTIKARFDVIAYLKNFIDNYPTEKGLFLHGSFGCGKTYLVVATFNELAKKNIRSAIIFWPEFLRDLKSSFDTDYEQKVQFIKTIPLLLIDDLGAESVTSWARDEILCSILQTRMDNKLTTFITSNQNFEQLEQHLSSTKDGVDVVKARRIIERIKQLTKDMELISKNLRK